MPDKDSIDTNTGELPSRVARPTYAQIAAQLRQEGHWLVSLVMLGEPLFSRLPLLDPNQAETQWIEDPSKAAVLTHEQAINLVTSVAQSMNLEDGDDESYVSTVSMDKALADHHQTIPETILPDALEKNTIAPSPSRYPAEKVGFRAIVVPFLVCTCLGAFIFAPLVMLLGIWLGFRFRRDGPSAGLQKKALVTATLCTLLAFVPSSFIGIAAFWYSKMPDWYFWHELFPGKIAEDTVKSLPLGIVISLASGGAAYLLSKSKAST